MNGSKERSNFNLPLCSRSLPGGDGIMCANKDKSCDKCFKFLEYKPIKALKVTMEPLKKC